MGAFTRLSTTVRNSTVTATECQVVVIPDMIMGSTDKILRMLVDAFVAAVVNGQRYGIPVEYEQLTKQHYTGEGEGLHASIMRFKTASKPLMHGIMQDMFRSVLEGSKAAHLQQATPTAAATGGGRRQAQQQQQQAVTPLQVRQWSTRTVLFTSAGWRRQCFATPSSRLSLSRTTARVSRLVRLALAATAQMSRQQTRQTGAFLTTIV